MACLSNLSKYSVSVCSCYLCVKCLHGNLCRCLVGLSRNDGLSHTISRCVSPKNVYGHRIPVEGGRDQQFCLCQHTTLDQIHPHRRVRLQITHMQWVPHSLATHIHCSMPTSLVFDKGREIPLCYNHTYI